VLEITVRRSKVETKGTIFDEGKIMACAVGVVIVGRRFQDVEEEFKSMVEETNGMGLEVNKKLYQIYGILRKPCNENECVRIGTSNFEIMENCTYLGTVLTHKNKLRREIEKKNYRCKFSILCTSFFTKESIST
jgi:hypothetical protein